MSDIHDEEASPYFQPQGSPMTKAWPYAIRVAGITKYVTSMESIVGQDIVAEREPGNKYDSHAIKISLVEVAGLTRQIGYVPAVIAKRIQDEDLPSNGRIVWKAWKEGQIGVRIEI